MRKYLWTSFEITTGYVFHSDCTLLKYM